VEAKCIAFPTNPTVGRATALNLPIASYQNACLECIAMVVSGAGCRDTRSSWVQHGCRLRSAHYWRSHSATAPRTPLTTIVIRSTDELKPPFWYTIAFMMAAGS